MAVKRSVTVPVPPVILTDGVAVVAPVIVGTNAGFDLLCTLHKSEPFVPEPLRLNVLPAATKHCAAGAVPAFAVAFGFIVSETVVGLLSQPLWVCVT